MIAALDIGTSKVCALVGELDDNGIAVIQGEGIVHTSAIRGGVVLDQDAAVEAIEEALSKAESTVGNQKIEGVIVGVAGKGLQCLNFNYVQNVTNSLKGITQEDIDQVERNAGEIQLPPGKELFCVLTQGFYVDDERTGTDMPPIGMVGSRLAIDVHAIHGMPNTLQNIVRCVNRAGYRVGMHVMQPLASARAVLTSDEMNSGVLFLDIGAGVIDMVLYHQGAIRHTQVIHMGGNHITQDISYALRISPSDAEALKTNHGHATLASVNRDESIPVKRLVDGGTSLVNKSTLVEIIQPRLMEMFDLVTQELDIVNRQYNAPVGVIITGGVSLTKGLKELAEKSFNLPVRIALPRHFSYMNQNALETPFHSTAIGLLLSRDLETIDSEQEKKSYYSQITKHFKEFFEKYF